MTGSGVTTTGGTTTIGAGATTIGSGTATGAGAGVTTASMAAGWLVMRETAVSSIRAGAAGRLTSVETWGIATVTGLLRSMTTPATVPNQKVQTATTEVIRLRFIYFSFGITRGRLPGLADPIHILIKIRVQLLRFRELLRRAGEGWIRTRGGLPSATLYEYFTTFGGVQI
jgi:hypothetical protein